MCYNNSPKFFFFFEIFKDCVRRSRQAAFLTPTTATDPRKKPLFINDEHCRPSDTDDNAHSYNDTNQYQTLTPNNYHFNKYDFQVCYLSLRKKKKKKKQVYIYQ